MSDFQQADPAAETATEIAAETGSQGVAVDGDMTDRFWVNSNPWEGAA